MIALMLAALISVRPDPDYMRPTSAEVRTSELLSEAQTCLTRRLTKNGEVVILPLPDGVALDWATRTLFGERPKPFLTIGVHDEGAFRRITLAYRHPLSEKQAIRLFAGLTKKCFPTPAP